MGRGGGEESRAADAVETKDDHPVVIRRHLLRRRPYGKGREEEPASKPGPGNRLGEAERMEVGESHGFRVL